LYTTAPQFLPMTYLPSAAAEGLLLSMCTGPAFAGEEALAPAALASPCLSWHLSRHSQNIIQRTGKQQEHLGVRRRMQGAGEGKHAKIRN